MPVHIGEMSTEIVAADVEAEQTAPASVAAATGWEARERWRQAAAAVLRDDRRTRAEGFSD